VASQQTLLGWNQTPKADTFNALSWIRFTEVSPGAGVANSTVQTRLMPGALYKIRKVAVSFTAIDNVSGDDLFNLVVGTGSYDTGATNASQTVTVSGTWAQNDTATVTINGHNVVATVTQGSPTLTNVAADIVAAILADTTSNLIVTASNIAGVVTITALVPGTGGNAITIAVAKSSTSGTIARGGATLAGGAAQTGVTLAPNDNSFSSGTQTPVSSTTDGSGVVTTASGVGYPTNVAVAGMAVFSQDIPFTTASYPAGAYQPATGYTMTYAPGFIAVAIATGGYGVFVPPNYDAVYPGLLPLTLRCQTPVVSGSITSLSVMVQIATRTPLANPGSLNFAIPGIDW